MTDQTDQIKQFSAQIEPIFKIIDVGWQPTAEEIATTIEGLIKSLKEEPSRVTELRQMSGLYVSRDTDFRDEYWEFGMSIWEIFKP